MNKHSVDVKNIHLILNDGVNDSRLWREMSVVCSLFGGLIGSVAAYAIAKSGEPVLLRQHGVEVRQFRLRRGEGVCGKFVTLFRLIVWSVEIFLALGKVKPRVVTVHHPDILPISLVAKLIYGCRIVYSPHEFERARADQRSFKSFLVSCIEFSASFFISRMVVVNDSIADAYKKCLPSTSRPDVVWNCAFDEVYSEAKSDLRSTFGISGDRKIIIYCGALVPNRGIEELLGFFESAQSKFALVFLGSGPLESHICTRADDAGNIFWHPPVPPERVPSVLSAADISAVLIKPVSWSYEHSLPNKFFESVASGVPIISSPLPEFISIFESYKVGIPFRGTTADSFFEACSAICELGSEDFQGEQERLLKDKGWAVQRERLLNVYAEVFER